MRCGRPVSKASAPTSPRPRRSWRRTFPTRVTQALQVELQRNLLAPVLSAGDQTLKVPLPMRVLTALPPLQGLLARVIGMGVRPEHVRSPSIRPG